MSYIINRGVFAIGAGGAEDPPRRNASYLGGKELELLFAICTPHYSFPLQEIIQNFCFGGMIFVLEE